MIIKKLNESFSVIIPENDFDLSTVQQMHDFLKAEKADAKYNFKVQRGWESPYRYLSTIIKEKTLPKQIALKVNNGHLELIKKFGIEQVTIDSIFGYSEFSEDLVNKELEYIKSLLPYQPYDYQEKCVKDCLLNPKQISLAATGAGKSLIIFMILYFLLRNNKKGYIIVPNINLLTQLVSDFEDYFKDKELAKEFLSNIDIQGGGNQSSFESFLTISTWQSLMNKRDVLDKADFILCDECLDGETKIKTIDGYKSIKDININDIVLTFNEESKIHEYKHVVKVHKNLNISSKEKMLEIKLENNKTIKITGNHKVLTTNGWKRADTLNLNDEIISIGDNCEY